MAITIKRRKGENQTSFLNRASHIIRRSGILLEARKRKFFIPSPNKRTQKLSALHKKKVLEELARKKKTSLV